MHNRLSGRHLLDAFHRLHSPMGILPLLTALVIAFTSISASYAQSKEGEKLLNEGLSAYQRGDLNGAVQLWEQAMGVLEREIGESHTYTITSMNNLAISYRDLGQYDKEQPLREKVLQLHRAKLGEDHQSTINSMESLATNYLALGQYDKALALREKALQLRRAKLGEDHLSTLDTMNNLAIAYVNLGQYDKALALNEQTLQLRRAKLGEDHPSTLHSMHNLAANYLFLDQHDKALALNEQTLQLQRAKLGEDHQVTLAAMGNLALTYSALGQYDKALVIQEQHLMLCRRKLGEDHPYTHDSMSNVAFIYRAQGQYNKALPLFEQNLQLRRTRLGEDHPTTLSSTDLLVKTYIDLGQRDKALPLVPLILAGVEKLRIQPGLGMEQRQSIFSAWSDNYQAYAKLHAQSGQLDHAFDLGDLSKARTLTDGIRSQIALRSLPPAEQLDLQSREAKAKQLRSQLDKLAAQGTRESAALQSLQKEIDNHNAAYASLLADLGKRYPKFLQQKAIQPAGAAQANQLLREGEVFISYLISRNGIAQAYILDRSGKVTWIDLGMIANLAQSVATSRTLLAPEGMTVEPGQLIALKGGGFQWLTKGEALPNGATSEIPRNLVASGVSTSGLQNGPVTLPADALSILHRYWHDTLVKPIQPVAGTYSRWIISPDKDLALLPFDALVETYNAKGQPAKILLNSKSITLVQSFAVYALLKQRDQEYANLVRSKDLLAMGNAVYADGWSENLGMKRGGGRAFQDQSARGYAAPVMPYAGEQLRMQGFEWVNLPGTAREVAAVEKVFGAGKVDHYLGQQASEDMLQQLNQSGQLKDYRYLLFSAHGYLARNPSLSSLVLSRRNNPPDIDGYVTSEEWPLFDMRSDLTVLSACDTGVGKIQAGEGVMGLPYALFVAGNKNTLLSLWPVDDDATAEFMTRFFSHLKSGKSQALALQTTKQEFLKHPQWSAPQFWAAFTLYGI